MMAKQIGRMQIAQYLLFVLACILFYNGRKFFTRFPFEFVLSSLSLLFISQMSFNIKSYVKHFYYEEEIKTITFFISSLFAWNSILYVVIKFVQENYKGSKDYYFFIGIGSIGLLFITTLVTQFLNETLEKTRLFRPYELLDWEKRTDTNLRDNKVIVKWETNSDISWTKSAILFQLVNMIIYWKFSITNKTLSGPRFFIDANYYYAITASMIAVNYYLISRWKWINFEVIFKSAELLPLVYIPIRPTKIYLYYSSFSTFLPFREEICTICLEKNPTTYFCLSHCFHVDCLIALLYRKSEEVIKYSIHFSFKTMTSINVNHFPIRKETLPSCPNCKQNLTDKNIFDVLIDIEHDHRGNKYRSHKFLSANAVVIDENNQVETYDH